jgi:glutathione peroxidase-family protein/uncharacterized membrane protein
MSSYIIDTVNKGRDKGVSKTIQIFFRLLLGAGLLYAGIGHLTWARTEFLAQVPPWLPMNADLVVILSGVVEILLGAALIGMPRQRAKLGWIVATFFVLIFPGNISQYVNGIDAFGLNSDMARGIRLAFQPLLVVWALWSTGAWRAWRENNPYQVKKSSINEDNFFQFTAQSLQGKKIDMGAYKGKTVLIVNTASKCGLTPQYKGLERLHQKYRDKGLVVCGFPCNQFGGQEPGDAKTISEGCLLNYGVSFQMFSKIEVNGENAHPLFKYLKNELSGFGGSKIKWNFTKFLIDPEGNPIKRFSPITKPEKIDNYLAKAKLLSE